MHFTMFIFVLVLVFGFHWENGKAENFMSTKHWNHTTNFFDKENWKRNELPCASDRIIFPETVPLVSMLKDVQISEIIMPLSGDFIFGPNMEMRAVQTNELHQPSCPGKDRRFTRWQPLSWFDPSNWCEARDDGRCVRAALDAAAVPAQFDSVVFPTATNSYFVDIDYDESITVGRFNFRLQWQTTHGFRLFTSSEDGRKEFVNSLKEPVPTVTIARKGCTDPRGCVPNTLQDKLFKKICSKVKCGKAMCDKPLKVIGACCPFCGSILLAQIGSTFTFTSFARQIRLVLRKHDAVQFSVMKTSAKSVQVAMTDAEGGELVERVLPDVRRQMRKGQDGLGLVSFKVISSKGPRWNPQGRKGINVNAKTATIIFVVIFLVLLVFAVVTLLYRRVRSGELALPSLPFRPRTPNFFRFSWSRGDEDTSGTPGVVQIELASPGLSILNPVYRGPEISVTPLDDSYDQPLSVSSILTNPAFVSTKSDEEEGEKKQEAEAAAAPPGAITVADGRQVEVTNLAFRPEAEEDSSEA